ncbi:uncharacterized protein stil [Eurosta solidaginis]|uniref:uncharacterized protein stil n=1 Tax=Eurosta solidaginis TaxID=178769 RepID=UPI003530CFD5
MEHRPYFIPNKAITIYCDIKMEPDKPYNDMENLSNAEEYAINPKTEIAPDTLKNSRDTNNDNENENTSRSIHIPYILNGELFEIQTQDGENVTVKCCNCPPDRVYRGSVRSTGNFHMHIKRRHPDLMGKIYDMKVNALVERRDRFMRNRKSTRRRNLNTNRNRRQSSYNGHRIPCLTQPHSELFKIKAAFQRHQQQQLHRNQQGELKQKQLKTEQNSSVLHKWNMIDHFLATPAFEGAHNITLMDSYNEQPQPLNYSLKQCANEGTIVSIDHASERTQEIIIKEADTPMNLQTNEMPMAVSINNEQVTEYGYLISHNTITNVQSIIQNDEHVVLHPSNSEQSLYGRATTMSAITPSPSDVSSYASPPNLNRRTYDSKSNSNLDIIKNELFLNEIQPIDLTVQPSTSDLSGCSGYCSGIDVAQTSNHSTSTFTTAEGNVKFDELLLQAINAIQSLQHEIQTFNQTNNNWLSLEIAKFKFLHPDFQFQYKKNSKTMEKKKEYLRCLMLFYFRKNKTATDTKRKICQVYGADAVSERVVQIWFSKFRKGDTSCIDGQRTGRPGIADCDKVKMLIERYPHFTSKKIGELISMSEKTVADYLQRLGYVVDGDGWRYDESAIAKCNNNSDSYRNESSNQPPQNLNEMDKEVDGVTDEELLAYCNKEFAYDESQSLNNCNVQIIAPITETYIITPRQQQQTVASTDFPYIEYDSSYEDINEKGKENDNTGNTKSNALPSFSEYFSNVYTTYLRGDSGNCAIESKNTNYVDSFNNGAYPLKSYE